MNKLTEKYIIKESIKGDLAIGAAGAVGGAVAGFIGLKGRLRILKNKLKSTTNPDQKKRIQSEIDDINKNMKKKIAALATGTSIGAVIGKKSGDSIGKILASGKGKIGKGAYAAYASVGASVGVIVKAQKMAFEINKLERQLSQAKTKEEKIYLNHSIEKLRNSALKSIAGSAILGAIGGIALLSVHKSKLKDGKTIEKMTKNLSRLKRQNSELVNEIKKDAKKYNIYRKFSI